jgi:DNA-binding response OmpR family regulator
MNIVIIDDDPEIIENLELMFQVTWPESKILTADLGKEGIALVEKANPDLIILDLGLPDIDGLEVLKAIRQFSHSPIIVLSVRDTEKSVVKALEWGADEYIVKPFRQMELLARVKNVFKRQHLTGKPCVMCGPMLIDFANSTVSTGNKTIKLTSTEAIILHHLMLERGKIVSASSLAESIWGDDFPEYHKALWVHISYLRNKIEPDPKKPRYLLTRPGIGYIIP